MKKCIFHYPGPIQDSPVTGSGVRPRKMLEAFYTLGFDVTVVSGYSRERKKIMRQIADNMSSGVKYEFVYSESTTMPTALSDEDHLPRNPFMDEFFLGYCKKNNVPVGLFYRDAYWKFDYYRKSTKKWVPYVTIPFYKHELGRYRYCVDTLFVPSNEFAEAIQYKGNFMELPSGGVLHSPELNCVNEGLDLFYVGGVTGINDIKMLIQTVKKISNVTLTICCPEDQWMSREDLRKEAENTSNICVIHESGDGYSAYIKKANAALVYYSRNPYRDLAMPVKLFDYIGYGKPVISTGDTAAGRFVEDNGIGWTIGYTEAELSSLIKRLLESKTEIMEKTAEVVRIASENTWEARARAVVENLTVKCDKIDK